MENPRSWGELERAIADSLFKYEEAKASGHIGWSQVKMIAEDLRNAGFVGNEHEVWEQGYKAAQEIVEIEGQKFWAHTVFPDEYNGNPYPLSE